jgi:hypothetical protein
VQHESNLGWQSLSQALLPVDIVIPSGSASLELQPLRFVTDVDGVLEAGTGSVQSPDEHTTRHVFAFSGERQQLDSLLEQAGSLILVCLSMSASSNFVVWLQQFVSSRFRGLVGDLARFGALGSAGTVALVSQHCLCKGVKEDCGKVGCARLDGYSGEASDVVS